jgi:hypothetical protein
VPRLKSRGDRGRLRRRALYTISELAHLAGVHRNTMRRMLEEYAVEQHRVGTTIFVTMLEFRRKMPWIWETLRAVEKEEYDERRVARAVPRGEG